MKKAIYTIGLFSMLLVLTSFKSTSTNFVDNNFTATYKNSNNNISQQIFERSGDFSENKLVVISEVNYNEPGGPGVMPPRSRD